MNPLIAPVAAGAAGAATALLFVLMPQAALEDWAWASGIPALLPAAAPPLGVTARAVLALVGAAMAALVVWSSLYLLVGPGGPLAARTPSNAVPVVRRADAHPDAPPRRPMTAADLGTPLMEVPPPAPVEQPVPADLDQPLAAFDPAAILEVPLPAPEPVKPLARTPILAPGERIDTYPLAMPPVTEPVSPRRGPERAQPTIDALLRRLEEVAAQRRGVTAG